MLKAVISHNEQAAIVELPMDRLSLQNELSQIGIRIRNADMHCTVDEVDKLSVQLRDGSEYVILDENADIDRTLYTCGFNSTEDTDRIDTEIAVLARAFDLDNVQSVTINGEVYPLS